MIRRPLVGKLVNTDLIYVIYFLLFQTTHLPPIHAKLGLLYCCDVFGEIFHLCANLLKLHPASCPVCSSSSLSSAILIASNRASETPIFQFGPSSRILYLPWFRMDPSYYVNDREESVCPKRHIQLPPRLADYELLAPTDADLLLPQHPTYIIQHSIQLDLKKIQ